MDITNILIYLMIGLPIGLVALYAIRKFGKIDKRYQQQVDSLSDNDKEQLIKKEILITEQKKYLILLPMMLFLVLIKLGVNGLLSVFLSLGVYLVSKYVWKGFYNK